MIERLVEQRIGAAAAQRLFAALVIDDAIVAYVRNSDPDFEIVDVDEA